MPWKHRDKGFSVACIDDGIETTEYGAESAWRATEKLKLGVRGAVIDKHGDSDERSLSAQTDYRSSGPWTLSGELRYDSEEPDGAASWHGSAVKNARGAMKGAGSAR